MNAKELSKKLGLVGSGAGVVMFLAVGLLHGALIGGTAGIQAGAYLFSGGLMGELMPRVLAALGMLAGVVLACVLFVTGGFAAGRLLGLVMTAGAAGKKDERVPSAARN